MKSIRYVVTLLTVHLLVLYLGEPNIQGGKGEFKYGFHVFETKQVSTFAEWNERCRLSWYCQFLPFFSVSYIKLFLVDK